MSTDKTLWIDKDEWWPVYSPERRPFSHRAVLLLDPELQARWERVYAEYCDLQEKFAEIWRAGQNK